MVADMGAVATDVAMAVDEVTVDMAAAATAEVATAEVTGEVADMVSEAQLLHLNLSPFSYPSLSLSSTPFP